MPNPLAFLTLLLWPLVMIVLFKRLPPERALTWSMLGSFMFLAERGYFDFPLVPTMDKYTLPAVTAVLIGMTMLEQKFKIFPQSRLASVLLVVLVLSPFATALTNLEPVIWGRVWLPPLSLRDGFGDMMRLAIIAMPFMLGYNYLATAKARQAFVTIFVLCGLIYSLPMLLEVRITPQISYLVYGYFPELFGQQIRFGGYRPVVFMGHGLTVAVFALFTVSSAAILLRGAPKPRSQYIIVLVYLSIVLVFCRTLGAILLALLFVPLILFTGTRVKGWAILICAVFVLSYPILRANDMIPTERLIDYAAMVQEDRAGSLYFRFFNEGILLDRASERPWFGWGSYLRNRVFDPATGDDISTTDGHWIIVIGTQGWVGYICTFGLLTLPLFRLWWMRKRGAEFPDAPILYGIALMLAANLVDLIPNSSIKPVTWLMAGMLLAARPEKTAHDGEDTQEEAEAKPRKFVRQRRDAILPQTHAKRTQPKQAAPSGISRKRRS